MNLTEVLATYRGLVMTVGREEANKWLYSHHEKAAILRSLSPLDLIVDSVNDDGEFIDQSGSSFEFWT